MGETAKISDAARIYEAVTGHKADSVTAVAVGLVWAIERANTLFDRVKIAEQALKAAQTDIARTALSKGEGE